MDKFDQEYDETSPEDGQEDAYEETPEDNSNELVSIRVNGKTLQVTAAVADEIHSLSENFTRKISEQGNELGHLRRQVSQITAPARQQQQEYDPDFDAEFYKSPSQALNKVKQEFRKELEHDILSRTQLQNEQAKRWEQFYQAYPDLRGKEEIIQPIFNRLASEYTEVPPDMLANATRKRLEQITGKKTTLPQGKAVADSGGSPSSRPRSTKPNKPTSSEETVSDINRQFWGRLKQK